MTGDDIFYTSDDGLRLFAKCYGAADAATTVLCMHGLTRNHKDFEPMISALSSSCRFICVDVRGRGNSDWDDNPQNYTPMKYAEDMITLLDAMKLQKVVLIGTSMGGIISMFLMKMIPERILGVVLNDVGPVVDPAGLRRISTYASAPKSVASWDAAAEAIAASQEIVYPDYTQEDWMAFARRTYREDEDGMIAPDYDPAIMNLFSPKRPGFLVRLAAWKLFSAMKARPLLILRGETSDVLAKKTARRMIKRHKNAKMFTVPRVGHAPILDETVAAMAIEAFLSACAL